MARELRAPSLNLVVISGNLTREPELRYTPSGRAVAKLGLASSRRYKVGEEWKEDTLFIDVNVWAQQAERVNERASKGSAVVVQGRLQRRKWQDQSGNDRVSYEIVANHVQVLDRTGGSPPPSGDESAQPEPGTTTPVDDEEELPF